MFKENKFFNITVGLFNGVKGQMVVLVLTIALFILSAAAPNATIGIGK